MAPNASDEWALLNDSSPEGLAERMCVCVRQCVCLCIQVCMFISPTWFMINGMTVYLYVDAEGYSFFTML